MRGRESNGFPPPLVWLRMRRVVTEWGQRVCETRLCVRSPNSPSGLGGGDMDLENMPQKSEKKKEHKKHKKH